MRCAFNSDSTWSKRSLARLKSPLIAAAFSIFWLCVRSFSSNSCIRRCFVFSVSFTARLPVFLAQYWPTFISSRFCSRWLLFGAVSSSIFGSPVSFLGLDVDGPSMSVPVGGTVFLLFIGFSSFGATVCLNSGDSSINVLYSSTDTISWSLI